MNNNFISMRLYYFLGSLLYITFFPCFNIIAQNNDTLLHKAVLNDDIEAVNIILKDNKEMTKAVDALGETALMYACKKEKPNHIVINKLIEAGSDILYHSENPLNSTLLYCIDNDHSYSRFSLN